MGEGRTGNNTAEGGEGRRRRPLSLPSSPGSCTARAPRNPYRMREEREVLNARER